MHGKNGKNIYFFLYLNLIFMFNIFTLYTTLFMQVPMYTETAVKNAIEPGIYHTPGMQKPLNEIVIKSLLYVT